MKMTKENRTLPENCGAYHTTRLDIIEGPRGGKDVYCIICDKTFNYDDLPLDDDSR